MKKTMLILIMGLAVIVFTSPSTYALEAPTNIDGELQILIDDGAAIYNGFSLSWDPVEGATKYAVELDMLVYFEYYDADGDYNKDDECLLDIKLSFNTANYDPPSAPKIEVSGLDFRGPLFDALYEQTGYDDSMYYYLYIIYADAKVKAINPGKDNGPQNNPFSEPYPIYY